jgi:DNA polymerase I-like protein with 3'-5' exonuclease and polymerase domains
MGHPFERFGWKAPLVLDIETSPETDRLLLLGLEVVPGQVAVLDGQGTLETATGPVSVGGYSPLSDPLQPWATFTKYDKDWMTRHGITVAGPVVDLQVMAWVMNENTPLTLEYVAKRYAGVTMDKRLSRVAGRIMFRTDAGTLVTIDEAYDDPAIRPQLVDYNRRDVVSGRQVFDVLLRTLDSTMWLDYWLTEEVPFTQVLLDMQAAGLPVNLTDTAVLKDELEVEAEREDAELHEKGQLPASFNLGSNDQMAAYLFSKRFELKDRLALPEDPFGREAVRECLLNKGDDPHIDCFTGDVETLSAFDPFRDPLTHVGGAFVPAGFAATHVGREYVEGTWSVKGRGLRPSARTPNGEKWSVSTPTLLIEHGQDDWVRELVSLRKKRKVISTYLKVFLERAQDGRIYAGFNQTGTVTGRLSSSGPNLQNLPARGDLGPRVRRLIQGDLLVGDYSQLEPRLMGHFSGDPTLLRAYREALDVYVLTANAILGRDPTEEERKFFKTYFLGAQYGAGLAKLGGVLALNGFPTHYDRMRELDLEFRALYSVLYAWKDNVAARAKQRGYVETLSGRRRRLALAFVDRKNWKAVGRGERQAVNAIIQGSAADIVRHLMLDYAKTNWYSRAPAIAQVHDEVLWEPRRDLGSEGRLTLLLHVKALGEEQANRFDLRVPLVFEPHWGRDWASAKEGADEGVELDLEADEAEDEETDEAEEL